MRKTILAILLFTIAFGGCKKENDQPVAPPTIEGLFGGNLVLPNSNKTGEVLLRIFPGNDIKITSFVDVALTETGNWQLQGTSLKAIFGDGNSILKLDATWNNGDSSLTGKFLDGDNKPVATTKLTKKVALAVEGAYKGLKGVDSNTPAQNFALTVKPTGAIVDNNGATGTWTLIDDKFTASLGAVKDLDPYTINGFYNLTTGVIRGSWRNDTQEGLFKVSK